MTSPDRRVDIDLTDVHLLVDGSYFSTELRRLSPSYPPIQ